VHTPRVFSVFFFFFGYESVFCEGIMGCCWGMHMQWFPAPSRVPPSKPLGLMPPLLCPPPNLAFPSLSWPLSCDQAFASRASIVHIDIDPAEIGKNKQPSVSLCADVKPALALPPPRSSRKSSARAGPARLLPWWQDVMAQKAQWPLKYPRYTAALSACTDDLHPQVWGLSLSLLWGLSLSHAPPCLLN